MVKGLPPSASDGSDPMQELLTPEQNNVASLKGYLASGLLFTQSLMQHASTSSDITVAKGPQTAENSAKKDGFFIIRLRKMFFYCSSTFGLTRSGPMSSGPTSFGHPVRNSATHSLV